ncbi:MAG: hypothetical protein ACLQJR_09110 [Stellaceae bacterium]
MNLHRQIRELVIRESEVEYLARHRRRSRHGRRRPQPTMASYVLLFVILLALALAFL